MEINSTEYTSLEWVGDQAAVTTAAANDPWFAPGPLKLTAHSIGVGTQGTGDITLELSVNSVVVATLTATGGAYTGLSAVDEVIAAGDRVDVAITAAGTGHQNLIYQLFYEA